MLIQLYVPWELCSEGLSIGGPSAFGFCAIGLFVPLVLWHGGNFILGGLRLFSTFRQALGLRLSHDRTFHDLGTLVRRDFLFLGGLQLFSTFRQALGLRLSHDRNFHALGALTRRDFQCLRRSARKVFSNWEKVRTEAQGCCGPLSSASPGLISRSVNHAQRTDDSPLCFYEGG